jgi:hypothetical protein
MSFINTVKTERRKDKPRINTKSKIKTTGNRKIVNVGINWKIGINPNKTPKLTKANIAVAVVVTRGKNSRFILIDFIMPPLAIILESPPDVPRLNI